MGEATLTNAILCGGTIAVLIALEHIAVTFFWEELPTGHLATILRYMMGCGAILIGTLFVVHWQTVAIFAAVMVWTGLMTILWFLIVNKKITDARLGPAEEECDNRKSL